MAIENPDLKLGGMTAENVVSKLIDHGISKPDAAIIASGWIYENFGRPKRTFRYQENFPAAQPECSSQFARQFSHEDWVDGESVVQAETTTGELGFNARFHKIEDDLDHLAADVAKAFACLAEMRASLRTLLDEIRAEINRLNSDVHECCFRVRDQRTVFTPPIIAPNFPRDPNQFMGITTFGDKEVSVWNTEQGVIMLPAITSLHQEILVNPRVSKVSAMARILVEEKPIIDHFQNRPVTKNELVDRFGKVLAIDGRSVRELTDILPDDARFESFDQLVDALGDREAAALRTSEGAEAAIAAAFGLDKEIDSIAKVSVDKFESIPRKVQTALLTSNVRTMSQLAKLKSKDLLTILNKNGIESTTGQSAAWIAEAGTLVKVR